MIILYILQLEDLTDSWNIKIMGKIVIALMEMIKIFLGTLDIL